MRLFFALLIATSAMADHLYVTDERAGTIQVIDTKSDRLRSTRIGNRPRGLTISPNRSPIYVAVSW